MNAKDDVAATPVSPTAGVNSTIDIVGRNLQAEGGHPTGSVGDARSDPSAVGPVAGAWTALTGVDDDSRVWKAADDGTHVAIDVGRVQPPKVVE